MAEYEVTSCPLFFHLTFDEREANLEPVGPLAPAFLVTTENSYPLV